jgi:hypothetical protein
MIKRIRISRAIALLMTIQLPLAAASAQTLYELSVQASAASGDHTPLWLNANKYGLSSLDKTNGYVRAGIFHPLAGDSEKKVEFGYGADVAVAAGYINTVVVQQAFAEARWLKGTLTIGSKEQPMELKSQELSTGSQTLGVNARPVPQVRLALPEYWQVPFTAGWLHLKGHIAYGITTDDGWQEDFTNKQTRYTEHALLHTKAGYIKIGKEGKPLSLEGGLEMACQFGGKSYVFEEDGLHHYDNGSGPKAFLHAFVPGGSDKTDGSYHNEEGNHLGSWLLRINYDREAWGVSVYADHFFEDHSMMFHLGSEGYGQGEEWNVRKEHRFFLYNLKDILLGVELRLKDVQWLQKAVVEYMHTKYQSGPVYHDHTKNISNQISGIDNYYNHNLFTGWQHWGQVMGNPLYTSPLYNEDGHVRVENNRFVAWHLGLQGSPLPRLSYRLLATWQRGYGTYYQLFANPEENTSLLAEACFKWPKGGWSAKLGLGMDSGKIYGNNYGLQVTVMRHFVSK